MRLTVFTPTYNRAYCLGQVYESLLRQTCSDFCWLIIDDGSTDETKDLVKSWVEINKIPISYHYKENGGMHTGYNLAYELIDTELSVCIDSDDYMTDNAVELIVNHWDKYGSNKYSGIIGLDCYKNGQIIGDSFPQGLNESTVGETHWKMKIKGDKKLIYRPDVMRKYPKFPVFENEKFVPLFCLPAYADQDYKMLLLNEVLCVVEYRDDGSSKNIIKSYFNNPRGFAYSRKVRMMLSPSFSDRFRNSIHYVSSSIIIKNYKFIQDSPKKLLTIAAIPFGIMLFFYLKYYKLKKEQK
jgi:glycosyltransferase involved in cell wall biosynthesis